MPRVQNNREADMNQSKTLTVVCLVVVLLAGSVSVSGVERNDDSRQSSGDSSNIQIEIQPVEATVSTKPVMYTVEIENQYDELKVIYLTVGVSPADEDFQMEVADQDPWFKHEEKYMWGKNVQLDSGEFELIGVAVYPESKTGNYELNATAGYANNGDYTRTWATADSIVTRTPCEPVQEWLECHDWILNWLIPILSLMVGILSFVGYERIFNTNSKED